MARLPHFVLGMLILQIYADAAPSDISKLEDIANIEQADTKLDSELLQNEKTDDTLTQGGRQKRFYNYYGFGYPPINPLIYPNNYKRDESRDTDVYGAQDPFIQIHRRLQEIADVVRQPPSTPQPPPPNHIPIFFPVLFIPQIGCGCNETPVSTQAPTTDKNQTVPDINNRGPPLDDERRNWGFAINETDDDDEDFSSRPISFDPIRINRTSSRPPPSVDHGSRQGDTDSEATAAPPTLQISSTRPDFTARESPSTCDGAVLSCCHQAQVTYDCFALQGCPDPTSYGNPCASGVILSVIEKFQKFYGQRNG